MLLVVGVACTVPGDFAVSLANSEPELENRLCTAEGVGFAGSAKFPFWRLDGFAVAGTVWFRFFCA